MDISNRGEDGQRHTYFSRVGPESVLVMLEHAVRARQEIKLGDRHRQGLRELDIMF